MKRVFLEAFFNIGETLLRFCPIPCRTGWFRLGNPGPDDPVFVTVNYHLTVLRLKKALRGRNAHLLVADSRGINVWCSSTGGRFTLHEVISLLKTTGIENRIHHRKIILPQLAAPAIPAMEIKKRTGWDVLWGPVEARDIPSFLKNNSVKDRAMKEVRFSFLQRLEMAAAWAFPMSLFFPLVVCPFWEKALIPMVAIIWILSISVFLSSPLFLKGRHIHGGKFYFFFLGFVLALLVSYSFLSGQFQWKFFLSWGILMGVLVLTLSFDLAGSTPFLKSRFHEDRTLKIVLDPPRCKGVGFCEEVCPRNCFLMNSSVSKVQLYRPHRCVVCGACIVQCPFDALHFETQEGRAIRPQTVRKFKLNIWGKRKIPTGIHK